MDKLRLSAFRIDGDPKSAQGFTDETRWNGWAKPKFTRDQIEGYLKDNGWTYSFDGDQLTINFEDHDEVFTPATFDTFRIGKASLYEISGLCWDDINDRLTPEELQSNLAQFIGTEDYYRGLVSSFYYTDGVKFLADQAGKQGAHWLVDAICSWQFSNKVRREEFQVWTLKTNLEKKSAVLICDDGNEHEITRQQITRTDFNLPEIKLYLELGSVDAKHTAQILMLPSER